MSRKFGFNADALVEVPPTLPKGQHWAAKLVDVSLDDPFKRDKKECSLKIVPDGDTGDLNENAKDIKLTAYAYKISDGNINGNYKKVSDEFTINLPK